MQRLQRYTWLRALVYFIFGLIITLYPHPVFRFGVYAISLYLLISGIISITSSRHARQQTNFYSLAFFSGAFKIIAALFILIFARGIVSILPIFLGIILLMYGIFKFGQAWNQRQVVNVKPWGALIYSVLVILAGAFLLFNPFKSVLLGFQIFGVILIIMSIGEIVTWWQTRHQ